MGHTLLVTCLLIMVLTGSSVATATAGEPGEFAGRRAAMLRDIDRNVSDTRRELGRAKLRPSVREALAKVPRHELVPDDMRRRAYFNEPLPIGYGQTISQPYIVAIMTELLDPQPGDRVLEIGTGSGYQAAVLAEIVDKVYSIEIIPELGKRAKKDLARLGYHNVELRIGDGYYGWPQAAPFDGIVVTAAASHVPPPLVDQLKPGARMIIPVGRSFFVQQLVLITRDEQGQVSSEMILPVRFVPLTGGHGSPGEP